MNCERNTKVRNCKLGLSKLEASQFHSFYHLRRPENPWDRNIVVRADYNLSLDFLDSIACDLPVGEFSKRAWQYLVIPIH